MRHCSGEGMRSGLAQSRAATDEQSLPAHSASRDLSVSSSQTLHQQKYQTGLTHMSERTLLDPET